MEFANKSPLRNGLSSRTGTLTVAAVVAVLAAILVIAAINSARNDNGGSSAAVRVLVANQLIPKGSSAQALGEQKLFRFAQISSGSRVDGAVTDLSQIQGKVATRDIYPGQQLSTTAFIAGGGALTSQLAGDDRAIRISLDSSHGLAGGISAGDRVDVIVGFNVNRKSGGTASVTKRMASNVLVLARGEGDSADATLRVSDDMAAKIAFAADNGKVWLTLRPPAGAKETSPKIVSENSILFGVKPLAAVGG
jgi:Flp pilus assembly protein CpaB